MPAIRGKRLQVPQERLLGRHFLGQMFGYLKYSPRFPQFSTRASQTHLQYESFQRLSLGGSLRRKDFFSILRAIPMGKLQAFVMLLGIDFNDCLFDLDFCDELFCLLVTLTRGTGFTGSAIEILLFRSASLQRVDLV